MSLKQSGFLLTVAGVALLAGSQMLFPPQTLMTIRSPYIGIVVSCLPLLGLVLLVLGLYRLYRASRSQGPG